MKRLLILFLFSIAARAQNFESVTASNIYGTGNTKLASGSLVWQAVNSSGSPIGYQVGGGGQQITYPTICSVTNGAITGQCLLPNVSLTNPMNVCFALTIKGTANQVLSPPSNGYMCLQPQTTNSWCSSGTCDLDQYAPINPSVVTALLNTPQPLSLGGIYSGSCSGGQVTLGYSTSGQPVCGSGSGGIVGITTGASSGLQGGGSTGTLNIALLQTCSSGQVLAWSGTAWACANAGGGGSVFSVFGRTGSITAQSGDYSASQVTGAVANTTTVNGHALSSNVVVSASDITTGTLPAGQLPSFTASMIAAAGNLSNNTTGTSGGLKTGGTIAGILDGCLYTVLNVVNSTGSPCGSGSGGVTSFNGRTGAISPASGDYTASQVTGAVVNTTTVNGHALSANVVVSASDITTGTLPHAQLPTLLSGDIPNNAANTSGTAGGLSANIAESQVTNLTTDLANRVLTSTTVNGHPLSGNVTVTQTDVGLSNLTNDTQTKAAVMPNTAPAAGKIPVGNSGGTAYAPVAVSGDAALASTGALIVSSTGGTAFAATATNAAAATGLNGSAIPVSKTIVGTNSSGQIIDASSATLANTTTGKAAGLSASGTLTGVGNGCLNVASNIIGSQACGAPYPASAGVPHYNGTIWDAFYSLSGSGSIIALAASPALTGLPTVTGADFGASPTATSVLNLTTVSTSTTDTSYIFGIDDPTTSYNNPFYVNVDGFSQLQVCSNSSQHVGGVMIGNFQATPTKSCQSLSQSPFNKLTVINNSNNRTEIALVHTNTGGGSGNVMQRFLSAAAVGTGMQYFNFCSGTTAIDGACNGTLTGFWDDNGNISTLGSITQSGTGPTQKSGKEWASTSVTVPAGYDFSYGVGNDNIFHCQLSSALGGGSCASSGLQDPGTNGIIKRTSLNTTGIATYSDVVALWTSCTSGFLQYNGTCASGGAVTSVFGRTGAVTSLVGDYTQQQITPTSAIIQTTTGTSTPAAFNGRAFIIVPSGTFTYSLPPSTNFPNSGSSLILINYGSGTVTVSPNGSLLNGSASNITVLPGNVSPNAVWIGFDGSNYEYGIWQASPITAIQNGGSGVTPSSGVINFTAGSGVTLTTSGNAISIAAAGIGSNWYAPGTDSGAANAYVVSSSQSSYTGGNVQCFKATHASTATAPTVNFNSIGVKTIVRLSGGLLAFNDIGTSEYSCLQYDGTNFDLLNPQGSTGTSMAVFSTSPTLTTPRIGTITDANGAPFLATTSTASAVDSFTITNAVSANPATVAITASGSDANINANLVSKGTGNVQANGNTICAGGPFSSLTDGATVTWAATGGCDNASLTFTVHSGSRTLNLTGLVSGGHYVLYLMQDATGGESLTGGTGCTWKQKGGGGGTFTLTNSANAIDKITFDYNGTNCFANMDLNYN